MALKYLALNLLLQGLALAGDGCPAVRPPAPISEPAPPATTPETASSTEAAVQVSAVPTTFSVRASPSAVASPDSPSTDTPGVGSVSVSPSLPPAASGTLSAAAEKFTGLGTRYGGTCTEEDCWNSGACSFVGYTLPAGIDGSTCVSQDIWNNGANCGGCISVTYKGKTITVMVTNETGGNATHLDMTPSTWAKLTNGYSGGGVDGIVWEWVTCPIAQTTPLFIKMHAGSSKYWFAATVENARERTAKVEVSSDKGATWKETALKNFNMYVLDGVLPDNTAYVRVTSISGSQVTVPDVDLSSGVVTKASKNY